MTPREIAEKMVLKPKNYRKEFVVVIREYGNATNSIHLYESTLNHARLSREQLIHILTNSLTKVGIEWSKK